MKPLAGKTVLITRDASQAGSFREMLVEQGAVVICIPTIKIVDPDDWTLFDQAAARLSLFDWVVFTSTNAVTKTLERVRQLGIPLEKLAKIPIATVGKQTAAAVSGAGLTPKLIPDKFQAEGLLEKLLQHDVNRKKIWLPRALIARDVLITELEAAGAEVQMTPVYQNVVPLENRELIQKTLSEQNLDWITFTSSSTVTNFFTILDGQLPGSHPLKLASIGALTTQTLKSFHLNPAFTAAPQNLEGLLNGMIHFETEHPSAQKT